MASIAEITFAFSEAVIAKIQLRPGDVLVVHCEHLLSALVLADLQRVIEDNFPGHRCLVFDRGLKLGVIAQAANVQLDVTAEAK